MRFNYCSSTGQHIEFSVAGQPTVSEFIKSLNDDVDEIEIILIDDNYEICFNCSPNEIESEHKEIKDYWVFNAEINEDKETGSLLSLGVSEPIAF